MIPTSRSTICCTFSKNNLFRGLKLLGVAAGLTLATWLITTYLKIYCLIIFNVLAMLAVSILLYSLIEKLEKLKIPTFIDWSSYENSILGRLEWIKVYGVLTGREDEAGKAFLQQEDMMEKVADFYEEEVAVATDALTSMMEPLIIVVLGVTVGGIVIAIYSPILSMYDAVDNY